MFDRLLKMRPFVFAAWISALLLLVPNVRAGDPPALPPPESSDPGDRIIQRGPDGNPLMIEINDLNEEMLDEVEGVEVSAEGVRKREPHTYDTRFPEIIDPRSRDYGTMVGLTSEVRIALKIVLPRTDGTGTDIDNGVIRDYLDRLIRARFKRRRDRDQHKNDKYKAVLFLKTQYGTPKAALVCNSFLAAMERTGVFLGDAGSQIELLRSHFIHHNEGGIDDEVHRDHFELLIKNWEFGTWPQRKKLSAMFKTIMNEKIDRNRKNPHPIRKLLKWGTLALVVSSFPCAIGIMWYNNHLRGTRTIIDKSVITKEAEEPFRELEKLATPQLEPGDNLRELNSNLQNEFPVIEP